MFLNLLSLKTGGFSLFLSHTQLQNCTR